MRTSKKHSASTWLPAHLALVVNAAVLLVTVIVVGWQLDNSYREVLSRASISANGLVQEKAKTLQAQFEILDLLMTRLIRKIRLAELNDRDRLELQQQFAAEPLVFPLVSRFLLLDQGGVIRLAGNQIDAARAGLPVCPPFAPALDREGDAFVGRVEVGSGDTPNCQPLSGVHYSRLFEHEGTGRHYELVAMLDAGMIGAGFFNEITWALGDKASYRIASGDGRFLVGFRNLPPGLSYGLSGSPQGGTYSVFSHRDATGAVAEVNGYDLKVEAVYSNNEVLRGEWRDNAIATVIAALVFLASWSLLSWLIVRILKRHEDALHEGEQRFNRSLSYASLGAWEWDVTSGELYWSDEVYALFGVVKGGFTPSYENMLARVHPDDRRALQDEFAMILEQGDEVDVVHRVVWPNGGTHWLQQRGGVRRDADGMPLNLNGIVADITDQYRAQRALAESESRFRTAFDSTAVGHVIINDKGVIVDANRAAEQMFGYDVDEMIGENVSLLMPEPHRGRHDEYLKDYQRTGRSAIIGQGLDVRGMRKNGVIFPMHLAVGVMEVDGRLAYIGSISDLSDIKNLEQQLRHSQKMDAIGQLAGGVAHDFNNVLGIAIGGLDLLKMKLAQQSADDKLLALLDNIHQSLWRGAKMTQNLLDFSRQDQHDEVAVDLRELVHSSLELIRKSLTSSIQVDESLGPATWPVLVNPDDFQDALVNLSLNARDAMPQGGVLRLSSANISIQPGMSGPPVAVAPGDYVCFSVADTGSGMSPSVREKVFEPFFSTKDKGKGTGLGLSMVYSFVKRARGDIAIQSEPGVGTTFQIYLPRAEGQALAAGSDVGGAAEQAGAIANGETVLIVDDEQMLAEVAREMFISLGFTPLVSTSATEALRLVESGELDIRLLFSDIVMPELDGVHLALAAHRLRPEMPILLTSGYAQDVVVDSGDESERAWCSELIKQRLPKPYDSVGLRERVTALLKA